MKKILFALLGVFLVAFALTAVFHGGGILGIAVGIACASGAWRSFRAARSPRP